MQPRSKIAWGTVGWLILSAAGGLLGLSAAALLVFLGIILIFAPGTGDPGSFFNMAIGSALIGVLCLPSGYLAIRRLMGKPESADTTLSRRTSLFLNIGLMTLPVWFALAALASQGRAGMLVMPFIMPVIVLVPLVWFLGIGARRLPIKPERAWKLTAFNLTLTMPLTLLVEILVLMILTLVWILWLSNQPGLLHELWNLNIQLNQLGDPAELQSILTNLLQRPGVIPTILVLLGFVTPLIEELLKPIAVLLFWKKNLTPRDGFLAGLVCGAAFALMETLNAVNSSTDVSWLFLALGRIGTGLLHVTTTGLVGWGIGWAASQKRPGRLMGALAAAILMHGVWNVFSILQGFSGFVNISPWTQLGRYAPFALVFLWALNLGILWVINHGIQKSNDSGLTTPPAVTILE